MAEPSSPYLAKKEIPLDALKRVTGSKVYVRNSSVVIFDDAGEDSGERHHGHFLFRELIDFTGQPLGYERVLDQKVVRRPGDKPNDKFTTTGTDTDGFTPFGEEWKQGVINIDSQIIVCAGIAEGYRLHEATGLPVACVVGEQKIPKVAKLIRSLTRRSDQVIVAVDNDRAGYMAALRSELPYLMPTREKDFSDVYQNEGGIEAVRQEAARITPPPDPEMREAELDHLLNRTPSDRPTLDPMAMEDERYYRAQQSVSQAPETSQQASQLILTPTEVTELGYGGMLSVAKEDQRKIAGYPHFKAMADILDLGPMEVDGVDQWLLASVESMTLLAAMMQEGLADALEEIPEEFNALKSQIFVAIRDGMLDQADLPGGAPAVITMEEGENGPCLRLQSSYDPDIRRACIDAGGKFDKASTAWIFPLKEAGALRRTIKALADNPLRRMVFMLPEDAEPRWLIGTPERVDYLQTMFLAAAGLAPAQKAPSAPIDTPDVDVPPLAHSASRDAGDDHEAPLDVETTYADVEPDPEDHEALAAAAAYQEAAREWARNEQESAAWAESVPTNEPEPKEKHATLARVRLTKEDGVPHLVLRAPFDKAIVAACRKVKRELDTEYPEQRRATFNKNESGAWHFPVSTRSALKLAIQTFCQANCDEIGVVTTEGVIEATRDNREALLAAMHLEEAVNTQEARGKSRATKEPPPSTSPDEARKAESAADQPAPRKAPRSGPTPDAAVGTVVLTGRGRRRELVLKSAYDGEVVAACKRIKVMLDHAHPDQGRATFNREEDKAWRFPVTTDKAMNDALSALCHETLPQIAIQTSFGKALATPQNLPQLSGWLHKQATGEGPDPTPREPPRAAHQGGDAKERSQRPTDPGAKRASGEHHGQQRESDTGGREEPKQERPAGRAKSEAPARAKVSFHMGQRNDYFMLRMTRPDPSIVTLCKEVHGDFRRRDRSWFFSVFSKSDLQSLLEHFCSHDQGQIEAVMSNEEKTLVQATPENCSKLARHFIEVHRNAHRKDPDSTCWNCGDSQYEKASAPGM